MANGKKVNQQSAAFKTRLKQEQAATKKRGPSLKGALRAGLKGAFGSGAAGQAEEKIKQRKQKQREQIRKQTGM